MTEQQYLLVCLMEECDEVSQRASKALRFGMEEIQPGQELTNRERLKNEIADLYACFELIFEAGEDLEVPSKILQKVNKIYKYARYSRELGILK